MKVARYFHGGFSFLTLKPVHWFETLKEIGQEESEQFDLNSTKK